MESLQAALQADGHDDDPVGAIYGVNPRHYVETGIPTMLFRPNDISQAHSPDEVAEWDEVEMAHEVIWETATRFFQPR